MHNSASFSLFHTSPTQSLKRHYDVWSATVARLGLGNDKLIWGYVGPETEQLIPSYPAYEPLASMYDVDYTAMGDREHEARVFGFSSSSNMGNCSGRLDPAPCRWRGNPGPVGARALQVAWSSPAVALGSAHSS
ncbi:hypothetical protein V6N12_024099 [Hibiscus sabdariffa]|uniref:Uncharacterized protein n=1 Tax=Hibiscus sabdariffa TaxID=183260 RepID=A0ABR2G0G0_9ROSI